MGDPEDPPGAEEPLGAWAGDPPVVVVPDPGETTDRQTSGRERFKNVTAGIQAIVFSVAACFGGWWAWYELKISRADRAALVVRQEEERVRSASEQAAAEESQRAREEAERAPVLNVSLEGALVPEVVDSVRYMRFVLSIENLGTRDVVVDFGSGRPGYAQPLSVARVSRTQGNVESRLGPWWLSDGATVERYQVTRVMPSGVGNSLVGWLRNWIFKPGESGKFEFLVIAQEPGVYLGTVDFTTDDHSAREDAARLLRTGGIAVTVSASTFVVVPERRE